MFNFLNRCLRSAVTEKTFVVLGCPRGGTSLIAGALSLSGVHMCSHRNLTGQFEDPEFKISPRESRQARRLLKRVIASRNASYKYWGWKLPNNIYYIREVVDLLVNPVYVFVYRDIDDIARSSAKHDGRDWAVEGRRLLEVARTHTQLVQRFERTLSGQGHVFRLEEIHADPEAFVDRILSITAPLRPERSRLLEFVSPQGGYHLHNQAGNGV